MNSANKCNSLIMTCKRSIFSHTTVYSNGKCWNRNYISLTRSTKDCLQNVKQIPSFRSFRTMPAKNTITKRKPDPLVSKPTGSRSDQAANLGFGGYFLLIIPVSTFCLGVWQVYRWFWKLDLIAQMEQKTSETVPFAFVNFDSIDDYEYKTVTLKGTFIPGKQLLLGPRSLHLQPANQKKQESGSFMGQSQSQSGYNIITPFKTSEEGITILVNRGWIPTKDIEKYKVHEQNNLEVEISGVVRKGENRSPFMSKTNPASSIWLYRDVSSMAGLLGTSEIFVDLLSINGNTSQTTSQLPIPGQTRVTLRNEHVSYFITWFSLSGLTSYMWYKQFFKRLPLR